MSGATIQERLAKLQKSGEEGWRKRLSRHNNEDLSLTPTSTPSYINNAFNLTLKAQESVGVTETDRCTNNTSPNSSSILADRMGKLEAAKKGWKKRVTPSDAVKFSVEGRMSIRSPTLTLSLSPMLHRKKRSPKPMRFRSKTSGPLLSSTPCSPADARVVNPLSRSISAPGVQDDELLSDLCSAGPTVSVPRADDETFTNFFSSLSTQRVLEERVEFDGDLDVVTRTESSQLLVHRRNIQTQRRRATMNNPLKLLAARTDLQDEYIETKTGIAEKELKRLKMEKISKNANLAVEALAGLASSEDFTAVSLRKSTGVSNGTMLPYKELMLLQIKGRRHVQTRLVEPTHTNINSGDNYVLVTPKHVYNYVGEYCNVIERSRGAEIAMRVVQYKDLGCTQATSVVTIGPGGRATNEQIKEFWQLLGADVGHKPQEAGHPDEDELYESSLIDTNMIYEVVDDCLEPIHRSWGCIPKIEVLDPNKILVLDFGSEMYIWNGKNTSLPARRTAVKLAKELWDEGYDYSDCDVCPLTAGGDRCGDHRPSWALIAKVTQHMETVLFREKFLDWPDYTRVIRARRKTSQNGECDVDGSPAIDLKPCDAKQMIDNILPEPDLELENNHLGRGVAYYDEETRRHSEVSTNEVLVWHIQEYGRCQLPGESVGQFFQGDSFVVKWSYTLTITGRELSGQPSKHMSSGRDRCVYYCWQGEDAPIVDQGAAALQTVELDEDRHPQLRAAQGQEHPAFLNLFKGSMVVYMGKREEQDSNVGGKLFVCRGETDLEGVLIQVPASMRHLRSGASFLFVDLVSGLFVVWHGHRAPLHTRKIARTAANNLMKKKPAELGLKTDDVQLREECEGSETVELLTRLGGDNRQLYCSLLNNDKLDLTTPRMFHLTSLLGEFSWTEITPSYYNPQVVNPYPFLQSELYTASQPTLFLIDGGRCLWLWQGWWDTEDNERGSGTIRFQEERRAAMRTALSYWTHKYGENKTPKAYLVWAGLEPLEFTNLFPMWSDRDDIAEINIQNGRKPGEVLHVRNELSRLTQSTYPLAQLQQRPLPDGVEPTQLEDYLEPHLFPELLNMTKEEFFSLPLWKKNELKKKIGLF